MVSPKYSRKLTSVSVLILLLQALQTTTAFRAAVTSTQTKTSPSSHVLHYRNLPTVEDVSNDGFNDQIYHGSAIVKELSASLFFRGSEEPVVINPAAETTAPPLTAGASPSSSPIPESTASTTTDASIEMAADQLVQLLTAQLSHQDGIRGFFSVYLTGEGQDTTADKEEIPVLLAYAMKRSNFEYLTYSLCMNLIVPTAMISVHNRADADSIKMAQNSAIVAKRTKRIMASLKGSINMVRNWEAIIEAASTIDKRRGNGNSKLIHFWESVFELSAYTEEQKKDIANEFADLSLPLSS